MIEQQQLARLYTTVLASIGVKVETLRLTMHVCIEFVGKPQLTYAVTGRGDLYETYDFNQSYRGIQ